MATYTIRTASGASITADTTWAMEEDGAITERGLQIFQDGQYAGQGKVVRTSTGCRIEGCDARLGAADGSETDDAYIALEAAIGEDF